MNEDLKQVVPENEAQAVNKPAAETPLAADAVPVAAPEAAPQVETKGETAVDADFSNKGLKELVDTFQQMVEGEDMFSLHKHAESLKAAFYKVLHRERIAAGCQPVADSGNADAASDGETVSVDPFGEFERGFKDLYAQYRAKRAAYLAEQDKKKEENFEKKQILVARLKDLLDNQGEDLKDIFPAFREIQQQWRETGPVPQPKMKGLYETYQHYVEMFYDYVKINNEFRELDFRKNLEAKTELCEKAEDLSRSDDPVGAFKELQKLHDEWKEIGPVSKEYRESIWERFRAATSVINKKQQAYYDSMKESFVANLEKKTALCEKVESLAEAEVADISTWNRLSSEVEAIQREWRTIGFATKKENTRIYERFRAACDKFFGRKKEFYQAIKADMQDNIRMKIEICERAEALRESTDWKAAKDEIIDLQRRWKEAGPISRKKNEQLWKRFRAACDEFFANRSKAVGAQNGQYAENLAGKTALIQEVKAFEPTGDREADFNTLKDFQRRWNEIGFVPLRDKNRIGIEFKETLDSKFDAIRSGAGELRGRATRKVLSERDKLVQEYLRMEQEIATWQNNIGFFAKTKNAEAIIADFNKKIEDAKVELAALESKIKELDAQNAEKDEK